MDFTIGFAELKCWMPRLHYYDGRVLKKKKLYHSNLVTICWGTKEVCSVQKFGEAVY